MGSGGASDAKCSNDDMGSCDAMGGSVARRRASVRAAPSGPTTHK